jgi:dienelactone hydrolase
VARKLLEQGHRVSARSAFLRAFTYYRTGQNVYGPPDTQEELSKTFKSLKENFQQFAHLAEPSIEMLQIPYRNTKNPKYDDKTMRGYFFKKANDGERRPTVIFLNGAETMSEDAYFWTAAAGMERGYNIMAADIPGDMVTRIYDPDFILDDPCDAALHSLVDYALSRTEVDSEKLAVIGVSMGGYKAGRMGQIENRVKAVVANAPMLNAGKVLNAMKSLAKVPNKGAKNYARRFCWQYGIEPGDNLKNDLDKLVDDIWGSFTVDPTQITCPFLAIYGENELGGEAVQQIQEFYNRLASKVKVLRATTEVEGAESHCQLNNFGIQQQISYDFLDEVFGL